MAGRTRVPGWYWVMQRVSAVLLIVGLAGHFFVLHFTKLYHEQTLSAVESTANRFLWSTRFWFLFDTLLLVAVVFHGLNGMYNIICDYNPKERTKLVLGWVLWVTGAVMVGLGIVLLARWTGQAQTMQQLVATSN